MIFPLVSNKRIKSSVETLIASERLPHAIIIEGDLGTGKRTLAKFLAQASVCDEKERPCGVCRNCHLADIGSHPDIEVVAPEEKKVSITKDQIESLRTIAYHSAHTAKRRGCIIEQADTMNPASQNKLLKVLEEPPSDVVFILITPSAEALLETVVSRCLVLSLYAPSFEEALDYLVETKGVDREEAEILLREERNNIGKALIRLNSAKESLGRAIAHDFFDAIEKGSPLSAMLSAVPLEKERREVLKFTEELSEILTLKIKKSGHLTETAREYVKMYDIICELTPTLYTNINLSLFFSALASRLDAVKIK